MKKIKFTVFTSVAFSSLAVAVVLPILAPLVRELNLTVSQGGWMISIGSIAMALMAAVWGRACDRFGRKPIMAGGFVGLFCSYTLFTAIIWAGLATAISGPMLFAILVLARALIGIFTPAITTGAQALMADQTGVGERSSAMAIIGAAHGAGFVLGPALGGALSLFGLTWPLVLATVLCLVGLGAVLATVSDGGSHVHRDSPKLHPFSRDLLAWLFTGVLTFGAIATVQITVGFYFQDKLGLTLDEAGPILAIALTLVGAAMLAMQLLQVRVLHWQAGHMILVGAPLWMAGLLILLLTDNVAAYFFAYTLFGAGGGLLLPGYLAGASLAVSADRQGAVAGFSAASQGIGLILGPVVSTMLYEVEPDLPLECLFALMLLLFLLFVFLSMTGRLRSVGLGLQITDNAAPPLSSEEISPR